MLKLRENPNPFTREDKMVTAMLCLAVLCNFIYWLSARHEQAKWLNVPPAPDKRFAAATGLGDSALAYRINGLMIQNLGDTGGRSTALSDYNFEELTKWFFLQDSLDQQSNYIPYLAAYYFGGLQEPEKYRPVLDYLEVVGQRPEGDKWRFLGQGIYIARFLMNDMDRALQLGEVLSKVGQRPGMPEWTRQMPAYILNAKGEKETAYAMIIESLRSSADKMDPAEVNALRNYVCVSVLDPKEAETNPICKDSP